MAVPLQPYIVTPPPEVVTVDSSITVAARAWGIVTRLSLDICKTSTGLAEISYSVESSYASTTFDLTGLTAGSYYLRAYATNGDGDGPEATAGFTIYDRPALAIISPNDEVVTGLPITVEWTAEDITGISAQTLRIIDRRTGYQVWPHGWTSPSIDPNVRSVTLHASDFNGIVNGGAYNVELTARNGVNITNAVTSTFTTDWAPPRTPTFIGTTKNESTASVNVMAANLDSSATITVWRVTPDGDRTMLTSGRGAQTYLDRIPPLGVAYQYEAQAVDAETGAASAIGSTTMTVKARAWAFNFGADAGTLVQLDGNPSASRSLDHGGALYHFADGGAGGGLPVWYGLTDRDERGSLAFDSVGPEDTRAVFAASRAHPVGWMRDPFGNRWRAHIEPSVKHGTGDRWQLDLDWRAVRWAEPGEV